MRPSFIGQTVGRLRQQLRCVSSPTRIAPYQVLCWSPDVDSRLPTTLIRSCGLQWCTFSTAARDLSWRHTNPGAFEAVAGIARQAQHETVQQQQQQQQRHAPTSLKPAQASTADRESTGAFARLPMVPVSSELIESALKRAAKVTGSKKVKNEAQKARSRQACHSRL